MTDRIKGFTVVLDKDIRVDDIEFVVNAIKIIKGVIGVESLVVDHSDYIARTRYRREVIEKINNVLEEL